jgi:hypothetical protein
MKLENILVIPLLIFLTLSMMPLLVALTDMMWWFYTNHTLSSIEWTETRSLIAIWSPIVGLIAFSASLNLITL